MLLYTLLCNNKGWTCSSLVVTYPVALSPTSSLSIGIKSASHYRSKKMESFRIQDGEIPTVLPFMVARVIQAKRKGSLILLANDEFLPCNHTEIVFENPRIILAVQENQNIKLSDGLAYLLNEMDRNNLPTKKFKILPYIFTDLIPSTKFLENLRESNPFDLNELIRTQANLDTMENGNHLPFINLAEQHFSGKHRDILVLDESKGQDIKDNILQDILANKNLDMFANLRQSVNIVRRAPSIKPNLAETVDGSNLLLRSIVVSNWLITSNISEDKKIGAKLAIQYHLPIKSWKEFLAIYTWTDQWEQVGWMGSRAILYLKNFKKDLHGAKESISIINRRALLILLFPFFFVISVYTWHDLSAIVQDYYLFTLLSIGFAIVGPLFLIDAFCKLAHTKMNKLPRYLWACSFLFVGIFMDKLAFQISTFYTYLGLLIPLIAWATWKFLPLYPKVGKFIFYCFLPVIPITALLFGTHNWHLLLFRLGEYKNLNLEIMQLLEALYSLLRLLS